MDRIGKVQEALKKFRDKQKYDELGKLQAVSSNKEKNVGEQSGKKFIEPVEFTAVRNQSFQLVQKTRKCL